MIEVDWVMTDQLGELAAVLVLEEGGVRMFWVLEMSGISFDEATKDEVNRFVSVWRERALANGLPFSVDENLLPEEEE